MLRGLSVAACLLGLGVWLLAIQTACTGAALTAPAADESCLRPQKYSSAEEILSQRILLWEEYAEERRIELSPSQQRRLEQSGDLAGVFDLERPVKFPNGVVDQPLGWLPALPADHPWNTPPGADEPTFAAWFEVRIVDPLLYDPENEDHAAWSIAYLVATADTDTTEIASLSGADSSCP